MRSCLSSFRLVLALLAASTLTSLAHAQPRFSFSSDGTEVKDAKTGLTWRRCSEGLTYQDNRCNGVALELSHEQALARAQSQPGWRLPDIKELISLVDWAAASEPAIDKLAFPGTPVGWFWASTPVLALPDHAWFVSSCCGGAYNTHGRSSFAHFVRLVR